MSNHSLTRSPATRRVLALTLAVATAATLGLAGCSSSSQSQSGGSATSGTVHWWGFSPTIPAATADIAAFNKVYPHIKVEYKLLDLTNVTEILRPALASNDGPDIFDISPGPETTLFAQDAIDLTPAVKSALGAGWKSKVAAIGIKNYTTSSGKLSALSVGSTFGGPLWINKELFDKYNLTPPTTLSEWVSDCATFKANGVGCFEQGVGGTGFNQDTLQEISDSIKPGEWTKATLGTAKWTNPVFVKALTVWKKLFSDGIMQPGALGVQQYPDANNQFLSQKYAMIMMGTWYTQYATVAGMGPAISAAGVANPKPFSMIPIAFPDVTGNSKSSGAIFGDSDYGLAINAKSKVKNAATTFAVWLTTSKKGQQLIANALNDLPALNGITPDFTTIKLVNPADQQAPIQKLIKDSGSVTEPREAPLTAAMQAAIQTAATSVAAGQATPAQAVATLQAAAVAAGVVFK